jgi:hypothetical protein
MSRMWGTDPLHPLHDAYMSLLQKIENDILVDGVHPNLTRVRLTRCPKWISVRPDRIGWKAALLPSRAVTPSESAVAIRVLALEPVVEGKTNWPIPQGAGIRTEAVDSAMDRGEAAGGANKPVANSWCFLRMQDYSHPDLLIDHIVDTVIPYCTVN